MLSKAAALVLTGVLCVGATVNPRTAQAAPLHLTPQNTVIVDGG